MSATCDNVINLYADGRQIVTNGTDWAVTNTVVLAQAPQVLAIGCQDRDVVGGILISASNGLRTNNSWRCSTTVLPGWFEVRVKGRNSGISRIVSSMAVSAPLAGACAQQAVRCITG